MSTGFALAQGNVGGIAVDDGGELFAQVDTVEGLLIDNFLALVAVPAQTIYHKWIIKHPG